MINYLKFAAPVAILLALIGLRAYYIDYGKDLEREKWEAAMSVAKAENQAKTILLHEVVSVSNNNLAKALEKQNQVEVVHDQQVKTIVQEKPVYLQCLVDKQVVDSQNAIKEGL